MALEQDCMLVIGKEASTLGTLYGIANCVTTNISISLAAVSLTPTFGEVRESSSYYFYNVHIFL